MVCDIPADVALYRAIQACHEFVEWLSRQVPGLCLDILSQRPVPIPSLFQVDARPGHFPQDSGKIFASVSCMAIASSEVELTTTSGGHHCCTDIADNKPKLSSRSTSILSMQNRPSTRMQVVDQSPRACCSLSETYCNARDQVVTRRYREIAAATPG